MAKTIQQLIDEVIDREGDYVNHPDDRGGPTRWGVTQAVARASGYQGHMRNYPRSEAFKVYQRKYWVRPGFSKVAVYSPRVAAELFDTGINMGPGVASGFLQRSLNVLNRRGRDYKDLTVDRQIGNATLTAMQRYLRRRGDVVGEDVLMKALESLQGARYIALAERRERNESFVFGWLRTRIGQEG